MTTADQLDGDASPPPAGAGTRLILGTVVSNGGDAAILYAQLSLLQRAMGSAPTVIEDNDPVLAHELFPQLGVVEGGRVGDLATRAGGILGNVDRPGLRRVARRLARHELPVLARRATNSALDRVLDTRPLVFYTGGTSLIEKYELGAKFRHLLRTIEVGRPLVLLPQSVGPFVQAANVDAMRRVAAGSALILLRDERSYRHLEQIGADLTRVRVVPDIVFCLAEQEDVERLGAARIPEQGPNVALGIRDCRKFFAAGDPEEQQAALEQQYAGLVTRLVRERGARVTFVSTCQGIDRYWTDDSKVSVAVHALLPADVQEHCVVDRGFHDTEGLRSLLREQDLVVANRLHGAILTLTVGVPVVPVEYEFKTREVFRQLQQENAVYSIEETASRSLADHVDEFVAGWDKAREGAAAALGSVVRGAWETGDVIRETLAGRGVS